MSKKILLDEGEIIKILSDIYWIDVCFFKLGTALGARDATRSEIAHSLLDFFTENDIGNKIAQIKANLRAEIDASVTADKLSGDEIEAILETHIDKRPSAKN